MANTSSPSLQELLHAFGFTSTYDVTTRTARLTHREGGTFDFHDSEWERWDGPEALADLLRKKLAAAREKERLEKLGEHEARRVAFYEAEQSAYEKDMKTFRPEEPNIRVYARCISAAMEVARRGLGRKAFSALMLGLVEEARDLGADIHANPTPSDTGLTKPEATPPVIVPNPAMPDGTWAFAGTVAKMHPDAQKELQRGDPDATIRSIPRGHVNGCALDADHKGGCFGPSPLEHPRPSYGEFKTVPAAKGEAPALSPRQALGEALACVDRALSLLNANREPTMDSRAYDASKRLMDARSELAGAYEAAK